MIGLLTAPTASLAELGGFSLKRQLGDKYPFIGCREDECNHTCSHGDKTDTTRAIASKRIDALLSSSLFAIAQIESQPEEFSAAKTCSAVKRQLSCSTSSLQDRYCENSCGMGILPVQVMQFKCGIAYPLGNRTNRKLDQVPGELVIPWECQINLVS